MKHLAIILLLFVCIPSYAGRKHHGSGRHRGGNYRHYHGRKTGHGHHRYMLSHKQTKHTIVVPQDPESVSFAAHKGSLSWPALQASSFVYDVKAPQGRCWKPVPGVDIHCAEGAKVNAVYDGEISRIFSVDDDGEQVVIVKHGTYFTVYNSLSQVCVKKGDHVCANQLLGVVGKDDDGKHALNFQIWKSEGKAQKILKPEEWLMK